MGPWVPCFLKSIGEEFYMGNNIGKISIPNRGALLRLVLAFLVLMTFCNSGKKWTEVESFTNKDKTISAGLRFRLEPVADGKGLIKNTGMVFNATFSCTRLEGEKEVSYRTESHFKSRASQKGGSVVVQTVSSQDVKQWPAVAGTQEIRIMCPFFPWEITSDKQGDVYFYMRDAEDGTVVSNIILIPVRIKVGSD